MCVCVCVCVCEIRARAHTFLGASVAVGVQGERSGKKFQPPRFKVKIWSTAEAFKVVDLI